MQIIFFEYHFFFFQIFDSPPVTFRCSRVLFCISSGMVLFIWFLFNLLDLLLTFASTPGPFFNTHPSQASAFSWKIIDDILETNSNLLILAQSRHCLFFYCSFSGCGKMFVRGDFLTSVPKRKPPVTPTPSFSNSCNWERLRLGGGVFLFGTEMGGGLKKCHYDKQNGMVEYGWLLWCFTKKYQK